MTTANMTPREAVNYADGANAFPNDFPKCWKIETTVFSYRKYDSSEAAQQAAREWIRQMKADGWTTKKKSYSEFIHITAVKKRETNYDYVASVTKPDGQRVHIGRAVSMRVAWMKVCDYVLHQVSADQLEMFDDCIFSTADYPGDLGASIQETLDRVKPISCGPGPDAQQFQLDAAGYHFDIEAIPAK